MLPSLDKAKIRLNEKPATGFGEDHTQNYLKTMADNSAKMLDMMALMFRANQESNSKMQAMFEMSNKMLKHVEQANRNSSEMTRWAKRIDKRLSLVIPSTSKSNSHPGNILAIDVQSRNGEDTRKKQSQHFEPVKTTESHPIPSGPNFDTTTNGDELLDKSSIVRGAINFHADQNSPNKQHTNQDVKAITDNRLMISNSHRLDYHRISEILTTPGEIDVELLKLEISTWIGDAYRQMSGKYYQLYITKILDKDETRMHICQSLILNTLDLITEFRNTRKSFWNNNRYELINHMKNCERKILGFLKTKFPRNTKVLKSIEFDRILDKVNNSQDPRYDMIKNSPVRFLPGDRNYIREIKLLINYLIQEAEKQYGQFYRVMDGIFRKNTNEQNIKSSKTKYNISKKLRDNIPLFTEEELDRMDFKCKSPEILRILIKWLRQLEELLENPLKVMQKKMAVKSIIQNNREPVPLTFTNKKQIADEIKEQTTQSQTQMKELQNVFDDIMESICELMAEKPKNAEYMDIDDIRTIKMSTLISTSLPFFAVRKIDRIIKMLRVFQTKYKSNIKEYVDLVNFSVFDLLRCRCVGSQEEIIKIYTEIKHRQDYFEVIRVKNRLDTPLNDVIINCKIRDTALVCEVQLAIVNQNVSEKAMMNDYFNHFLYELERSKYGPLCEACLMISDKDPRMSYAPSLKKIKMALHSLSPAEKQAIQFLGQKKHCHNFHEFKEMSFEYPFICSICSGFNKQYESSFNTLICKLCNIRVCPACYLKKVNDDESRINFYLKASRKISKELYESDSFHELRDHDPKLSLEEKILEILIKQNASYGQHIRFTQGRIEKRGYKRLKNNMLCPAYFSINKELPSKSKAEDYDIVLIPIRDKMVKRKLKEIKIVKELEFMSDKISRANIDKYIATLGKEQDVLVVETGNKTLCVDFIYDDEKVIEALEEKALKKIINECVNTQNTTLDLGSRKLKNLEILKTEIQRLKHVLTVVADENELINIDPVWQLPNLKKLSLKSNCLHKEKILDIRNPDFIDLFMASNNYKEIPVVIAPKLTRISFKKNGTVSIANLEKSSMNALEELGVAQNSIQQLCVMKLPSLKRLIFRRNKVVSLDPLLRSTMPNLEQLCFEDNKITELPVLSFQGLKKIELGGNKIKNLDSLTKMKLNKLEHLDVQNNQLTSFPTLFVPELKTLMLSENNIKNIDFMRQTDNMKNLQILQANQNQISSLCKIVAYNLKQLHLKNNEIEKLTDASGKDSFLESEVPSLKELKLVYSNKFYGKPFILMVLDKIFNQVQEIS